MARTNRNRDKNKGRGRIFHLDNFFAYEVSPHIFLNMRLCGVTKVVVAMNRDQYPDKKD